LAKPSLVMEHGGGEKLKAGSAEYETIKRWLEDGAPEPGAADPTVTALEVSPRKRVMVPGQTQQIAVTAVWSDGRRGDVTATARYDALNDSVASVTPPRPVDRQGEGRHARSSIRFGGQAAVVQATLPFAKIDKYPDLPKHNFIDEH